MRPVSSRLPHYASRFPDRSWAYKWPLAFLCGTLRSVSDLFAVTHLLQRFKVGDVPLVRHPRVAVALFSVKDRTATPVLGTPEEAWTGERLAGLADLYPLVTACQSHETTLMYASGGVGTTNPCFEFALRIGPPHPTTGALVARCTKAGGFTNDEAVSLQILGQLATHMPGPVNGVKCNLRCDCTERLGGLLRVLRRRSGRTGSDLARSIGASAAEVSRWESGDWPSDPDIFRRWLEALAVIVPDAQQSVLIVQATDDLLRALRADPSLLDTLTPARFEAVVGDTFAKLGFKVIPTGRTFQRDGGVDFVLVPNINPIAQCLFAVQVKHHRTGRKTSAPEVQRLLGINRDVFKLGVVVTNTSFTSSALWLEANPPGLHFLRLRNRSDFVRWLRGDAESALDARNLPLTVELGNGCRVELASRDRSIGATLSRSAHTISGRGHRR